MHLTEVYILAHPELKDSREAEGPYINLRDVNEESTNKIQQNQLKVGWCFGPPALKSCCFFFDGKSSNSQEAPTMQMPIASGGPDLRNVRTPAKKQRSSEEKCCFFGSVLLGLYPSVIESFLILFEPPSMGTLFSIDQDVNECCFYHVVLFYSPLNDDLSCDHRLLSPASLER